MLTTTSPDKNMKINKLNLICVCYVAHTAMISRWVYVILIYKNFYLWVDRTFPVVLHLTILGKEKKKKCLTLGVFLEQNCRNVDI